MKKLILFLFCLYLSIPIFAQNYLFFVKNDTSCVHFIYYNAQENSIKDVAFTESESDLLLCCEFGSDTIRGVKGMETYIQKADSMGHEKMFSLEKLYKKMVTKLWKKKKKFVKDIWSPEVPQIKAFKVEVEFCTCIGEGYSNVTKYYYVNTVHIKKIKSFRKAKVSKGLKEYILNWVNIYDEKEEEEERRR